MGPERLRKIKLDKSVHLAQRCFRGLGEDEILQFDTSATGGGDKKGGWLLVCSGCGAATSGGGNSSASGVLNMVPNGLMGG